MAYLKRLQVHLPSNTETRVLASEDVAFSLHELVEAEQVDFVLMRAHGYSGKARWPYGSTMTSFLLYGNTRSLSSKIYRRRSWRKHSRAEQ